MKRTLTEQQKKTLSVLAIVIFVLLSAALAWFVGRPMVRFARQPEQFRAWVDGHGAWGPLAYAAMVFLQVSRWRSPGATPSAPGRARPCACSVPCWAA